MKNKINCPSEYSAEVVVVSPRTAAKWLATSEGNPRWSNQSDKIADDRRVKSIAEDIERGDWAPGTNGIGFDTEGHLVEGHHRLSSIIRSGISVPCVVVYGITNEAKLHIDDNKTRTERQRTGIDGYVLGAAAIHKAVVNGYSSPRSIYISTEEKLRLIDLHPSIHEANRLARHGRRGGLRCASGVHAFMCALENGVSQSKISRFVDCVNTGFVDDVGERAAIVCRNYLANKRLEPVKISSVVQCALYDFVIGKPRTKPYANVRGKYFDMNVACGNKLYTSLFGDE